MTDKKTLLMGAALAALAMTAACSRSQVPQPGADAGSAGTTKIAKGECSGVNACKGQGECGGVGHSCAGKNSCKGQGWISLGEADCKAKGGQFKLQ